MEPLERAWREERAAVVATVARRLGDLGLAEDAVQEAFAAAAARWPVDGVPARPGAWLTTTAWRKALDVVRRERRRTGGPAGLPDAATRFAVDGPLGEDQAGDVFDVEALPVEDDLLRLLLACCHPSLALDARVALTLRHVAGLTAREIAAAFLVPEPTMAKRLVRARGKVRDARIPFNLPDRASLPERLAAVHAVIYLVFTEGHLASGDGPAVRVELCDEAVWLARQVHRLVPDDAETTGLLALLLLQHSRTAARRDAGGDLVPFDRQDRESWDGAAIAEARDLLATTGRDALGPYQVQAAIALLHAAAPEPARLRWGRVAELYGVLERLAPSPVVAVNHAMAAGRARGPQAGLALLAPVLDGGALDGYAPLHAVHADLLERAGDRSGSRAAWRRAAEAADNPAQRAEMLRRAGQ